LTGAIRAIRGFDFFPDKETTVEFMKTLLATAAVVALLAPSVFGQAEQIIKQRAKELSNQNNVRQGVAPPTPAAPPPTARPAAQPAAATPAIAQQQNIAKLKADIAALGTKSQANPDQKLQFVRDIVAAARGAAKPSQASASKFAGDLAAALADKTVSPADQTRLAQDIEAIVNGAALPQSQTQAIAADVQAILQVSDVKRPAAVTVADDLKAIAAEVQKKG
jgi:hypothetical protein